MVRNVVPPASAAPADEAEKKSELVLTRKAGESITIGNIEVKVDQIRGKRTRIRIIAPISQPIRRSELPNAA